MARQTFTWFPDRGSDKTTKPRVEVIQFGEGYEARVSDGVNTSPMSWNLVFTRQKSEADAILAFIRARAGSESFYWTNPMEELGVYVCREWKVKRIGGPNMQISCTFEQVFEA